MLAESLATLHGVVDGRHLGPDALCIPEPPSCLLLGVLTRHATRHEILHASLEVKSQLRIDVVARVVPARRDVQRASQAGPSSFVAHGHPAASAAMTRPTAS